MFEAASDKDIITTACDTKRNNVLKTLHSRKNETKLTITYM